VPGGFVNAGTFANTTTVLPPAMPQLPAPMPVYQPLSTAFTGVTVAAPNVRLAGPKVRSISTRYSDSIGSTVTQDYVGTTGVVYQPKPLVLRRAPAQRVVIKHEYSAPSTTHHHTHSAPAPVSYSAPAPSGPSIHADTVNINYGNNSQVGTTSSNNGSTVGNEYGHGHSAGHHGYTSSYGSVSAPVNSGPIDFGDGIGDGTWGNSGSVNTGSYSVGTTSVLEGYQGSYQSSAPYSAPIGQ